MIKADSSDVSEVKSILTNSKIDFSTVVKRGALVTVYKSVDGEEVKLIRFRKVTTQFWVPEIPASRRFEPVPIRNTLKHVCEETVQSFGWIYLRES